MRPLFLACIATLVLSSATARACSCLAPPLPKKALAQAAAVFAGTVKSVEIEGRRKTVTFEITRTWKGTTGTAVKVVTPVNSAACGFNFEVGKSYLVYCYRPKVDGKPSKQLHTNICSRTTTLKRAKGDLLEIGPGAKPK